MEAQSTVGYGRGIGTYTHNLLAALAALDPPDLEILPLRRPDRLIYRSSAHFLWDQFEVPIDAWRQGADVLHCAGSTSPVLASCPVVLTVHDLIWTAVGGLSWRMSLYWEHWLRHSIRFASAVIANSESTRRDILRFTSVPSERIDVIPLGITRNFRPAAGGSSTDGALARHGLRQPYILAVGASGANKNLPVLIEAFGLCRRRGALSPAHSLAIVGLTQLRNSDAASTGEGPQEWEPIKFLGQVSSDDLVALYQGAEFFVYPSAYEGFGLPPLEAMACGTPVIASKVSSIPEVTGEAALLVAPPLTSERFAEAMAALASDPLARKELSRNGLQRASLFGWEKAARRTVEVYRRVARGN